MSLKLEYHQKHWHTKPLSYLVKLSKAHGLDPFELLKAFFRAIDDGAALCGPLRITLRERSRDQATFLLTKGSNISAQLKLSNIF